MSGEPVGPKREAALSAAFVRLADTLVADFDVIEFLSGLVGDCLTLFAVDTAGVLLDDGSGAPRVVASSTEDTRLVELFEVQVDEGPCLDCFRTRAPVVVAELDDASGRWPSFAPGALAAGFHAVHAVPLRLRNQTVGALNMFTAAPGELPAADLDAAQALADVAAIGILQERAIRSQATVTTQLQGALHSRVVIEQAKGVLADRGNLDMASAFSYLRRHARRTNQRLSDVAAGIAARTISPDVVLGSPVNRDDDTAQ
jgi:transcriptional regulator with GAF, ATPase, and Fis domain